MIRNEVLEHFILGYGLEIPDGSLGPPEPRYITFDRTTKAAYSDFPSSALQSARPQ